MSLPVVAIVGAPNIGKSTLFNRLVGERRAIVTNEPGVTRDRLYGTVTARGHRFRVVDTGGLTPNVAAPFASEILAQAEAALDEAVCVLLMVDVRSGATAIDREVADFLRRRSCRVVLVANKVDSEAQDALVADLYDLGLGDPVAISAAHSRGIDELLDLVVEILHETGHPPSDDPDIDLDDVASDDEREIRLAIVGRPNVGKSSIVNRLIGSERVVVSDLPGTTRDAVDTVLDHGGRRYRLVDTAGIRRRGKVGRNAEAPSVVLAKRSIERADIVALVLDATREFAAQDAHVAGIARDAYRPVVVVVNKWDAIEGREAAAKQWLDRVRERLKFLPDAPVVLASALSGQRVVKVLERAEALFETAGTRVSTPELNKWLRGIRESERSAPARGRSVRLYYATQTGVRPPRILLFCNEPRRVHFSLRRHLSNTLRERFGFEGVPIVLEFRPRRD